jgi:hypothetical protein
MFMQISEVGDRHHAWRLSGAGTLGAGKPASSSRQPKKKASARQETTSMDESWFAKWFSNRGQAVALGLNFLSFLLACASLWKAFQANASVLVIALLLLALIGVALVSAVLRFLTQRELVGLVGVREVWAGIVDDRFLRAQISLDIFLKDGHRFFKERQELLLERLIDTSKTTRIFIVHPDYNRIEAIAEMDPDKAKKRIKQKADCLLAITTMQEIAKEAARKGVDPRIRNHFLGYQHIRTYNAVLNTLECKKMRQGGIFNNYKGDLDKIARETETVELWSYRAS